MNLSRFCIFFLLVLTQITTASAQFDSLDCAISTGQTGEIQRSNSFHNLQIITAEEIQLFNFQTVNDVLQYCLNNFSIYTGKEGYTLNYVGTGRKNVRMLLNGLPIFQNSIDNFDLSKIAISNVHHIEILTGSNSVFYGSNAVIATINVITKRPVNRVWQGQVNLNTSSKGNINTFAKATVNFGRHSMSLGFGNYFFSGVGGTDSLRVFQWKPQIRSQTEISYSYRLLNEVRAYFSTNFISSRVQDRGYPVTNTLRTYDTEQKVNHDIIHAGIIGKISKYHQFDFSHTYIRYHLNNEKTVKLLNDLTTIPDRNRNAYDELKYDEYYNHIKISKTSDKSKFDYETGLEFTHQRDLERSVLSAVKTNITEISALANVVYKTSENLRLKAGLRYANSNKFATKPLYELGLKYMMSDNVELVSNLSRGYRNPTFNELFYTFENPNLNISGNLKLQSESFSQFNTTFRITSKKSWFYTNVYWVNSQNGIQLALVDAKKQLYQFINVKSSKLLGQNVNFAYKSDPLRLEFSVSNNGINQYPKEIGSYYFSQELLFKTLYTIKSADLTLGFISKYQGGRNETREDALRNLNDFTQQGFWLLDFSLRKKLFHKPVYAHVGLKNITNTLNVAGSYLSLDRLSDGSINTTIPISIDYGRRIWFSVTTEF